MRSSFSLVLGVLFLASCQAAPEKLKTSTNPEASRQFEQVKLLVGDWYRTDTAEGDAPTAIYRLSVNETTIVERLFVGKPREMVTMYFMDDGQLTLTHFCAL